jgi:hypothetical protein
MCLIKSCAIPGLRIEIRGTHESVRERTWVRATPLMRDKTAHEWGTCESVRDRLGFVLPQSRAIKLRMNGAPMSLCEIGLGSCYPTHAR